MFFGASIGRVGADFRPLVARAFEDVIVEAARAQWGARARPSSRPTLGAHRARAVPARAAGGGGARARAAARAAAAVQRGLRRRRRRRRGRRRGARAAVVDAALPAARAAAQRVARRRSTSCGRARRTRPRRGLRARTSRRAPRRRRRPARVRARVQAAAGEGRPRRRGRGRRARHRRRALRRGCAARLASRVRVLRGRLRGGQTRAAPKSLLLSLNRALEEKGFGVAPPASVAPPAVIAPEPAKTLSRPLRVTLSISACPPGRL